MNTLEQYTTEGLKALAYDNLAQIEQCQNNIKIVNQELARRNQPAEEPIKSVEEKENV